MEDSDYAGSENSDLEVNEAKHSSLLTAVSQLDTKQRVKPPTRKESSFQVSEFHLVKSDANRNTVQLSNLTKLLGQRGSHAAINKKLQSLRRKSKTLPRPLEKPVAARIQRSVGFQNVKKELGRWDAVVQNNRVANQLSFPLKQSTVSFETTNDFITKLKSQARTPLEAKMDEILNSSAAVQEERKEEEEYQLTLAEMVERRREMAKLRAQQSYMVSKAHRQNKIKSKKYHRIQRRERIRQQLKDFETLQKTDPEAALQQLEQLERTRAEERVSLRHRSTGQWAKNKAVRAKYDRESREELAQQLAVSRDLTQKIHVQNSSDDEEEEEDDEENGNKNDKSISTNNDNPWITRKTTSEVQEFVSGYRKFWEERNKKSSEISSSVEKKVPLNVEEIRTGTEIVKQSAVNRNAQAVNEISENENDEDCKVKNKKKNCNPLPLIEIEKCENEDKRRRKRHNSSINGNTELPTERNEISPNQVSSVTGRVKKKKQRSSFNVNTDKSHELKNSEFCSSVIATTNSWVVTPIEPDKRSVQILNGSGERKIKKTGNKRSVRSSEKSEVKIVELFDDMEDKLRKKVDKKLKKWKSQLKITDDRKEHASSESDNEGPSLKMKRAVLQPQIDEKLVEQTRGGLEDDESSNVDLRKMVEQSKIQTEDKRETPANNIDPNKFIAMKPKHLQTELPDIVTEGDEGIDDNEEEENEDRQMTITEAFAEDDVVAEFRKDKEEVTQKSQPQDVDLTLPGWGEWGGKNLSVSARKKRRFVIKFPEGPPRKDANKGDVIINEEKNDKIKVHQVSEIPFPFTGVKEFEASIRNPIGSTWVPETAHRKLTKPAVATKLGSIIEPMDEDMLVKKKSKIKGMP